MGVSSYYCCVCNECVNENYSPYRVYIDEDNKRLFKKYGFVESGDDSGFSCKICGHGICSFCVANFIKESPDDDMKYKFITKAINEFCEVKKYEGGSELLTKFTCYGCSKNEDKNTVIKNKVEDIQKVQYAGDEWFDKIKELLVYIKPDYKVK